MNRTNVPAAFHTTLSPNPSFASLPHATTLRHPSPPFVSPHHPSMLPLCRRTAVLDGQSMRRVLRIRHAAVVLIGLNFTRGVARSFGGGILATAGNTTLVRCALYQNSVEIDPDLSVVGSFFGFRSNADGGGFFVSEGNATLSATVIAANYAAAGGGGLAAVRAQLALSDCEIRNNTGRLRGGGAFLADSIASLSDCVVDSNDVDTTFQSSGISVISRERSGGGGISVIGGSASRLTLSRSKILRNHASGSGGGVLGWGGTIIIRDGALFSGNTASQLGGTLHLPMSNVYVVFPLSAGYWLSNIECVVSRERCPRAAADESANKRTARLLCEASFRACSYTADPAGGGNARIPATACESSPSGDNVCYGQSQPVECTPATDSQDCDWQSEPNLLTNPPTRVFTPPAAIPIDDAEYPYPCAPGVQGSADPQFQSLPVCRGPCMPGRVCPAPATLVPLACAAGGFCPQGSASPVPCPGGRFSRGVNLTRAEECQLCAIGSSCPPGSTEPTPCLPGSFSDAPGQRACTLCPAGKHQTESQSTTCVPCPIGAYCEEGTVTPTVCPPGTWQPDEGLASKSGCRSCPPGFWCTAGERVACLPGFYNPHADARNQTVRQTGFQRARPCAQRTASRRAQGRLTVRALESRSHRRVRAALPSRLRSSLPRGTSSIACA